MNYYKPALTREQQADLLISRGMLGDRDQIISQLSAALPLCDLSSVNSVPLCFQGPWNAKLEQAIKANLRGPGYGG